MPQILGPTGASELLLNNTIITAEEMYDLNFVGKLIKDEEFEEKFQSEIVKRSMLPPEALKLSKQIIRNEEKVKFLKNVNHAEIERNSFTYIK